MMQPQTKKKLTSLNEMFGNIDNSNNGEESNEIDIDLLVPFSKHPFKLYTGPRLEDMVKSIREFGVLEPLIVRTYSKDPRKSEILAGHNRWNAAKLAGIRKVPFIKMDNLSDEEAMLVVTETNLIQRSFADLAHSERAFVLAKHHEALKAQGKRMDLLNEVKMLLNADEIRENETFRPVGEKLNSDQITGDKYSLSGRTVSRYLRINELIDDLKAWIDSEKISIRAGVELSYLSEDNQTYLVDILNNNSYKVDVNLASELRDLELKGKLNEQTMEDVLAGCYKKPKKVASVLKGIKVKPNIMKKYFNEKQSEKEVEDIIDKAFSLYFQTNQS